MNDHHLIEFILAQGNEIRLTLGEQWDEFLEMLDRYLRNSEADDKLIVFDIRRAIRMRFPVVHKLFQAWLAGQGVAESLGGTKRIIFGEEPPPPPPSPPPPSPFPPPSPYSPPSSVPEAAEAERLRDALEQLTGIVEAAISPEESFRPEDDSPPVVEKSTQKVQTYANLQGEDYAYLNRLYSLTVKLSDQKQPVTGTHISAPKVEVPVEAGELIKKMQVKLYAPDFELAPGEPGWLRDLTFYVEAGASGAATFTLLAQDRLEERYFAALKVQYLVQGEVIGEASRRVEMLQSEAVEKTPLNAFPPAPGYPLDERGQVRLDPVPTPVIYQEGDEPVCFTITIQESEEPNQLLWDIVSPYLAEADFPPGPYFSRHLGVEEFVKTYLTSFGMPGDWPEDHMDMDGRLKPGSIPILFQNLIELRHSAPPQLWTLYQLALQRCLDRGHSAESFTILFRTADTHIPWELMPLSEEAQAGKMPPLLGTAHRVGRWLLEVGAAPDTVLDLKGFTLAAPTYVDDPLPEAQAEQLFIKERYAPNFLDDSPQAFLSFMQSGQPGGGTGILHYAGHGDCCTDPIRGNWLVLTDKKAFYDARSASNDMGNRLGKLRPTLAFFNACNVGRAAPGPLGSNGGWGRALLHQQYKGYIGPLWSVYDKHARDIAQTFYTLALDKGLPLGEVMRQIRARFAEDNHLFTYLAYLYLGHPLAKIVYSPY